MNVQSGLLNALESSDTCAEKNIAYLAIIGHVQSKTAFLLPYQKTFPGSINHLGAEWHIIILVQRQFGKETNAGRRKTGMRETINYSSVCRFCRASKVHFKTVPVLVPATDWGTTEGKDHFFLTLPICWFSLPMSPISASMWDSASMEMSFDCCRSLRFFTCEAKGQLQQRHNLHSPTRLEIPKWTAARGFSNSALLCRLYWLVSSVGLKYKGLLRGIS